MPMDLTRRLSYYCMAQFYPTINSGNNQFKPNWREISINKANKFDVMMWTICWFITAIIKTS